MKKFLYQLLVLILIFCIFPVIDADASSTENAIDSLSDEPDTGLVLFNVRIPDDFSEVVYLHLTGSDGEQNVYPIHSESNYMVEETIPVGTYGVSGYLDQDLNFSYTVTPTSDTVTITSDTNGFIELIIASSPDDSSELNDATEDVSDHSTNNLEDDRNLIASDEDSEDNETDPSTNSSTVGPIVTIIVTILILLCIVIFIGFIYRYQNE